MSVMEPVRIPLSQLARGDRAVVTVTDPIFGPIKFDVHPFKRSDS